ncbi:hypothetical protein LTR05_007336 [Lithohypha guttulata]|uniref:C3H1-type domain-containing protein n=1 Tax=Lithohypha guttulata TaxID=1690604 RepID=A0AAN7Y4B2_9EURO|nr:hypothetical protein LTR05_007336 [Lithohypha guttulata]
MDPATGSYMQYNNDNDADLSSFFHGLEQYATPDISSSTQFDPALFAEDSLAPFSNQQNQQNQTSQATTNPNFNQAQRQTQSHSPALPQFKPSRSNTLSPAQYGQNVYNAQAMGQSFDPQLLARPTPSPGPFDQYSYAPQQMNYGQSQFDYRFNSFQPQRQASAPQQAFHPQVGQHAQHFMNGSRSSSQAPPHMSQVQVRTMPEPAVVTANQMKGTNGLSYPFQQANHNQPQHRFIEPSLLNADGQLRQNQAQAPQSKQMESSPYFAIANTKMTNNTLDPRALQMQQHYAQMQQTQTSKPGGPYMSAMQSGQVQNLFPAQLQVAQNAVSRPVQQPRMLKDSKSSGSITGSDDDLEIEDEEPQPKPAVITIARPTDERGQLLWDVVNAVWAPHNKPAPSEQIRTAITFVGSAVQGLRNKWKQTNEQLKQAELPNSATRNQVDRLKAMAENYRAIMETLAFRITQFAHPSILKRLGENSFLLSALYSFLLDRATAEDHNSTLVTTVLRLGTKLTTVHEEQLEKVKWTKILARFSKKSTNESKDLALIILNNAKKATARKKTEASGQGPASPSGSSSGQVAGIKRPREGSDGAQQAKKAAVKPASKPLSVQLAEQKKLKEKAAVAKDVRAAKAPVNGSSNASAPIRPKVASTVPQKSSPFASLMSASKRPGTTIAERAAKEKVDVPAVKAAAPTVGKEPLARPEPPIARTTSAPVATTSASSFLGLLADMEKPKDSPKAKVEDVFDETPEARVKRLRKESRRKLRVSWKPEGQLVETKIFEHDIDEETGHEDSMMRDVGDTGKEGEMLKHRHKLEEMDEDSDDEIDYFMPTEVDLSDMHTVIKENSADGEEHNFVKCGGNAEPESPASEAQSKHESGNMMTVYAAGEQPNTPKEPQEGEDDDFNPVLDFGEPSDGQVAVRQREQQVIARRNAYQPQVQPQFSGIDVASVLSNLYPQSNQQQTWSQQPQGQAQQQYQNSGLQSLLAQVAQSQQQQNMFQAPAPAVQPTVTTAAFPPNIAALLGQLQQNPQNNASLPVGNGDNPNPFPGAQQKDKKKDKDKKKGKAPIGPDGLPLNYKTKICQFWLEGKCTKGDACTYRHDQTGGE